MMGVGRTNLPCQRYKKTCQCPTVPGLITAPPAPRLIPKSSLGVSIWVEVLLGKYLYATPTHRLCADLNNLGAPVAMGTLTGGLKKLAPLFEPLSARCWKDILLSGYSTATKRVGKFSRQSRARSAIAGFCG